MQAKESNVNEDDEVDIVTVDKDSAFSDSDMSQEELCFLPAIPLPDAPEQQDKCLESSSKLVESNNSGSPLSEEGRPNGRTMNHASSPLEGEIRCHMHVSASLCGGVFVQLLPSREYLFLFLSFYASKLVSTLLESFVKPYLYCAEVGV